MCNKIHCKFYLLCKKIQYSFISMRNITDYLVMIQIKIITHNLLQAEERSNQKFVGLGLQVYGLATLLRSLHFLITWIWATRALLNYNVCEGKIIQPQLHFKNKDITTEPNFRLSFGTSKFQQPSIHLFQ